jgi:hypothetical protein
MTYDRKTLISLSDTAYYHVVSRCVRRAWLWGYDKYAGRDFSHRKAWVLERLTLLASMFAIDVCAYAILSNHLPVVRTWRTTARGDSGRGVSSRRRCWMRQGC